MGLRKENLVFRIKRNLNMSQNVTCSRLEAIVAQGKQVIGATQISEKQELATDRSRFKNPTCYDGDEEWNLAIGGVGN